MPIAGVFGQCAWADFQGLLNLAFAMSIMRDSWVEIPGRSDNKINAALAIGGVPLTVHTVENLLDTRIDHVAVLDFEGFAAKILDTNVIADSQRIKALFEAV